MPLEPGTRIGPYEVISALGAGGMGEVYRGRDTKLGRDVAIKTLPALFATDPERTARFNREAQLLAALNHAHIGGIYGLEEDRGSSFLILEFIDGMSLEQRLLSGPVPADEALGIARQIAEALEAAHEKGIIHRDLKPANIMLTAEGQAKILDFGLARALDADAASAANSPTLTVAATRSGIILGTAAYMAPEQAKARTVDKRADIWAFGVVLFEMLAGVRPFGGETISETIAAIIKEPPSWAALPRGTPLALRSLLARTLEKDPRQRLRDIGDARLALDEIRTGAQLVQAGPVVLQRGAVWQRAAPWALAILASVVAVVFAVRSNGPPPAELPPLKFTLPITGESLERTAVPSISPNGKHVVFAKNGMLWIRPFDQLDARQLPGTSDAQFPFWSPDSLQVAYLTSNVVWRVGIDGSSPIRIAPYSFQKGGRTPGGVWRSDETLIFAPAATGTGLVTVPVQGGDFTDFYKRDEKVEGDIHRPALLPDGRSLVFVVDRLETGADTIGILSNGVRKDVLTIRGEILDSPVYSPTGHILYHRETTAPGVWALPFDLSRLEATGPPFLVVSQGSYPSISSNGTLIYSESSVSGLATLAWLDVRSGAVTEALEARFLSMQFPRLSPNGRLAAAVAHIAGEGLMVIVVDLQRRTFVRIGTSVNSQSRPAWRDDRTIVYTRSERAASQLVMRAADGTGADTAITQGTQPTIAAGRLAFMRLAAVSGGDLYHMALGPGAAGPGKVEMLQQLPEHEWEPALSPQGTLLAFNRGDAGQSEVVLRTYPMQTEQWQVSASGGSSAVWSPRGDALYYRTMSGPIMRVDVRVRPSVTLGTPQLVKRPADLVARVGFDVSPDGTRLLMVKEAKTDEQRTASVAVVQNWLALSRK